MAACDHCAYRNSWDCEDGYNWHKDCEEFTLDFDSLTKKQQRVIRKILDAED